MQGYWNKQEETAQALRGGWLHTGDIAKRDKDGYFMIVDRIKGGQVPGKLGAQVSLRLGPQEVQRPLGRGGWEVAGAEDRHIRGRAGLSSEWDPGEAPLSQRGRVWSCRGWEGAETSAPLSPAPRPRAHARTQIGRASCRER